MRKKGRWIAGAAVCAAAVLLIVGLTRSRTPARGALVDDSAADVTPAAKYQLSMTGYEMTMEFDASSGSFTQSVNGNRLTGGSYTVSHNEITTVEESSGSTASSSASESSGPITVSYILDGDYLLPESLIYSGDVPADAKTFDLTCKSVDDQDYAMTFTFRKDGTYHYLQDKAGSDNDLNIEGTYSRDGALIRRTADNGSEMLPLYIYRNHITSTYYTAASGDAAAQSGS